MFTKKKNLPKNSKTQIVMKIKKSNCNKNQTHKMWSNSNTKFLAKLKNSHCDKTQIARNIKKNPIETQLKK